MITQNTTAQDYRDEISSLRVTAETGEQWAELCKLEKRMMEAHLEENDWRDTPLGWMHQDLDGEFYSLKDAYEYQLELDR